MVVAQESQFLRSFDAFGDDPEFDAWVRRNQSELVDAWDDAQAREVWVQLGAYGEHQGLGDALGRQLGEEHGDQQSDRAPAGRGLPAAARICRPIEVGSRPILSQSAFNVVLRARVVSTSSS